MHIIGIKHAITVIQIQHGENVEVWWRVDGS